MQQSVADAIATLNLQNTIAKSQEREGEKKEGTRSASRTCSEVTGNKSTASWWPSQAAAQNKGVLPLELASSAREGRRLHHAAEGGHGEVVAQLLAYKPS